VIPSLIHKVYNAKKNNTSLTVWGDGSAKREFIFADDLAKIIFKLCDVITQIPQRIIVSNPNQISIKEVVNKLCKAANFCGEIIWDTTKPNGQNARPSDITILTNTLNTIEFTNFDKALKTSYDWFESNWSIARM
jgi:GDP-L-fucose synthase